jgi:hypothetical protein
MDVVQTQTPNREFNKWVEIIQIHRAECNKWDDDQIRTCNREFNNSATVTQMLNKAFSKHQDLEDLTQIPNRAFNNTAVITPMLKAVNYKICKFA